VRYRSELYQGARHGYTMADGAAYDQAAYERHFTELFALLGRALEPRSEAATDAGS
jgi:carboxymethylenebutenolidase